MRKFVSKFGVIMTMILFMVLLSGCVNSLSTVNFNFTNGTLSGTQQVFVRYSDGNTATLAQSSQAGVSTVQINTDNTKRIVGAYIKDGNINWVPKYSYSSIDSSIVNVDLSSSTKPTEPADYAELQGTVSDGSHPGYVIATFAVRSSDKNLVGNGTDVFAHSDPMISSISYYNNDPMNTDSGFHTDYVNEGFASYTNNGLVSFVISSNSTDIASIPLTLYSGTTKIYDTTRTLTFNSNGGSAVDSKSVILNHTATQPTEPTKSGYTFLGWYSDSGLTTYFDFYSTPITADMTLYAKWGNPPSLTPVTVNAVMTQNMVITFGGDTQWRDAITAVKDGTTTLTNGTDYTIGTDSITINAGVLSVNRHTITIEAMGYSNASVLQNVSFEYSGLGTGTINDPYQISTADELNKVRDHFGTGVYFKLAANIDLSSYQAGEGWAPIGDYDAPFQGAIDGNGYKITNLTINRPTTDYIGLFGVTDNNASVANMKLENVNVTGQSEVGGLIGGNNGGIISNSYATGSVSGTNNTIGGLVGSNTGPISNSYATGSVSGPFNVGGLTGSNTFATISSSYAAGNVTGNTQIGGLVGINYYGATISYSYATGNVSGTGNMVGGLVGNNNNSISNSYATGSVSGAGDWVGGLTGENSGVISNSFAIGSVTIGSGDNAGGLTGNNYFNISNSFYDKETTGQTDTGKGVGKPTADMKLQSTYEGWDFSTTWGIDSSRNGGYPYLRAVQKYVTYDGNGETGGDVPFDSTSYLQGIPANVYSNTGNLVKTGYTFTGWNTEADGSGTNYAEGATFSIGSSNVTLYAKWMVNPTYSVTYYGNGASSGSAPIDSGSYEQGATVSVQGNTGSLVKSGYTFVGWNTSADGSGTSYAEGVTFPIVSNTELFAQWQSANALLSGLSVDQGTLSPTSELTYRVDVANAISSLNLFLTKADPKQSLTVTGAVYSSVTGNVYSYNASDLIEGTNLIQVVVTAENHIQNTYNITVDRALALSNNADLSGLTLSSGTLTPVFAAGKKDYNSSVANDVSSITVTASVYDSNATMAVNGVAVASGHASGAINLNVGSNIINIVVTAQNGAIKTYTVTVTRDQVRCSSCGAPTTPTVPSDKIISTEGKLTLPVGKTGEVSLGDAVTISIPADASGKELKLTIEKVLDTQKLLTNKEVLASPIYEILKNFSENFSKPVSLTFAFDPKSLKSNQKAAVFYYDEAKKIWVEVGGGKVNGDHITVDVNHFTKFAVFAVDQVAIDTKPMINLSDISGHWAEAGIKQALSSGIVSGYPDGTFKPNATVRRSEFAVMLMNALKPQGEGTALTFTDTAKIGAWAQKAVAQAVQAGIIKGYEDGSFRPDAEITRPEMAAMIANALGQPVEENTTTDFADDKDIPAWAKGAVAVMKKLGIIEGKGANEFAPDDQTTRAEAVTVLLKMLAQKSK